MMMSVIMENNYNFGVLLDKKRNAEEEEDLIQRPSRNG